MAEATGSANGKSSTSALRCEAVARAELGDPIKRAGAELLYRCPGESHRNGDQNTSLTVNSKKNVWACFVCQISGKAWALAAFLARPALLLDESDTAFTADKEYAQTLRGILNSGYRRSGKASLCVGQGAAIEVRDFSTFCPKAIAGIGKLPDTVADRSIPIRLKRARRRQVERFRERDAAEETSVLVAKIAGWCQRNLEKLRSKRPEIPEKLSDRQADVCEPLLAIAELAGGAWPKAAESALLELCTEARAGDESTAVRLLQDVRAIFAERPVDEITSRHLCEALAQIETSPWPSGAKENPSLQRNWPVF